MATEITVPRLGWTMEEGLFQGWLKNDGDSVREGEPLFTLESDKATQEVGASGSGTLRISPEAPGTGGLVKVGALLGFLLAKGERVPLGPEPGNAPRGAAAAVSLPGPPPSESSSAPPVSRSLLGEITASPRAVRTASALGIDLNRLRGTGRTGRIRESDVLAAAASTQLEARSAVPRSDGTRITDLAGRELPLSPARRTIARHLSAGVHEAAPVTLCTRADATHLILARQQLTAVTESGQLVPSFNDLLVKLTGAALEQHPLLQTQWRNETLFVPTSINIALAVETEAGLVAPVIREVPKLTIQQVGTASRALIERARAGRLSVGELLGGTFTVTSLGSLGIDQFTPIINLPQSAILGIGRIAREPVVIRDQLELRDLLTLSLTFDHRVIDGAPAARFLETLRQLLVNPLAHLSSAP